MKKVKVIYVNGNELHQKNSKCYISLDCSSGVLTADADCSNGTGGVSFSVYHGHEKHWRIPALRADAANAILDEIAPLAEVILAGYDYVFDSQTNKLAQFTDAAIDARDEINKLLERDFDFDTIKVWCAGDWFAGFGSVERQANQLLITADSSDEQLANLASEQEDFAQSSSECDILEDCLDHMRWIRERLRADAEEVF
jgi:hypothetical protein